MDYSVIIYIIFGIMPSLVWLSYYLTKDLHPEPKKMIIKIFLWGSLITLPVFFIQIGLKHLLDIFDLNTLAQSLIYWFVIIALSEEFLKYLAVRMKALNDPNLDEPLDVMLYMTVAALGFAAVENILYLFTPLGQMSFDQLITRTLAVDFVRFIGATFLHTLCSATVGYFLAISFYKAKRRKILASLGILLAVGLHGLYDFSIMTLEGYVRYAVPISIIFVLAIFSSYGFKKLQKMKSICLVSPDLAKQDKIIK